MSRQTKYWSRSRPTRRPWICPRRRAAFWSRSSRKMVKMPRPGTSSPGSKNPTGCRRGTARNGRFEGPPRSVQPRQPGLRATAHPKGKDRGPKNRRPGEVQARQGRSCGKDRRHGQTGTDGAEARVMPAATPLLAEHGLGREGCRGHGPRRAPAQGRCSAPHRTSRTQTPQRTRCASRTPAGRGRIPHGREEQIVPMSPLRRVIAKNLVAAQQNAALLTTFNELDMSEVIAAPQAAPGSLPGRSTTSSWASCRSSSRPWSKG